MRLTEITPSNKTYVGLMGSEKLSVGSLYFSMLNLHNGIKNRGLSRSVWDRNFENFNKSITEALKILENCPEPDDPFVRNLKSVLRSYQDEIKVLNNKLIN